MKSAESFYVRKENRGSFCCAFSIVELLVVVVIIGLLLGVVAPAFTSLGKTSLLATSATRLTNLCNQAWQNSRTKNVSTLLIVLTDPLLADSYRVFALFELNSTSEDSSLAWKQISKWEVLPPGIAVDSDPSWSSLEDNFANPTVPPLPKIQYKNKTVGEFKYILTLPGGVPYTPAPVQIRLVEGSVSRGSAMVKYTHRNEDGTPKNYYHITILPGTGRVKVDRP